MINNLISFLRLPCISKSSTEIICLISMMQRKREFGICLLCGIMRNSIRHKRIKGNPCGLPFYSTSYVYIKSFLMPNRLIYCAISKSYQHSFLYPINYFFQPLLSCHGSDSYTYPLPLQISIHNLPSKNDR